MSRGVNKAILVGNLGADPEMRSTTTGVRVATLSLATNESWKDANGNRQEKTEWHRLVLWRGLAEVAENYLRKGARVYVEGRIQTRNWETDAGEKRYTTEINVTDLVMLGDGSSGGQQQRQRSTVPADFSNEALAGEDDLPF